MVYPYVEEDSIGAAYQRALDVALDHPPHLTIHISEPVAFVSELPESDSLDDWEDVLNLGPVYESYCDFVFSEDADSSSRDCSGSQSGCPSGESGRDWIDTRIHEQFCGKYDKQAREQHHAIIGRLNDGHPHAGWSNALVAQVYQLKDLEDATESPFPNSSCLTQMQFKPKKGTLNLLATFRSQTFDNKAYGNLIALAMLLARTCEETGHKPGYVLETANNVTFASETTAQELQGEMLSAPAASDG